MELKIHLPKPHAKQLEIINCDRKRIIIRSGRRFGKTVAMAILAVESFLAGNRILYATPTMEQMGRFWATVTRALQEPIKKKCLKRMRPNDILSLWAQSNGLKQKQHGTRTPFGVITVIN